MIIYYLLLWITVSVCHSTFDIRLFSLLTRGNNKMAKWKVSLLVVSVSSWCPAFLWLCAIDFGFNCCWKSVFFFLSFFLLSVSVELLFIIYYWFAHIIRSCFRTGPRSTNSTFQMFNLKTWYPFRFRYGTKIITSHQLIILFIIIFVFAFKK